LTALSSAPMLPAMAGNGVTHMRLLITLLAAGWITAAAAQAQGSCMKGGDDGAVAAGRLAIGSARDAAGRPQRPYILTLAAPACLTAPDAEDNVKSSRTVHIYSSDEKIHAAIAGFVGKPVRVRGTPFHAHTGHHHAPIVMDIAEIGAQ
jgi:hypothetical protein